MSANVQADTYSNAAGTGAPDFPFGLGTSAGSIKVATIANAAGTGPTDFNHGLTITGQPRFNAIRDTSGQTINSGSFQEIQFNNTRFNNNNVYNTGTFRYTPGVAGVSHLSTALLLQPGALGTITAITASFYKNAGRLEDFYSTSGLSIAAGTQFHIKGDIDLNHTNTDFFEIFINVTQSGVATYIASGSGGTYFCGHQIG